MHEEGRREEGEMFNAIKAECLERGSKADKKKDMKKRRVRECEAGVGKVK